MATSEPTDNDTYATALSQGYESQPLLTPINEQDDEEKSKENHHPGPRTRTDPVRKNSSDGPHQATSASTDTRSATATKCSNANPQVQDPIQILCKATHYELTNLGKALTCPICCSTYSPNSAVILPCVHAYCRTCIVQALRFKPECPTCKQPANKRSLVDCPVLNEMAIAYKQVARALGWSPSVYSSMVHMTQLPPSVHHYDKDDDDDDDGTNDENDGGSSEADHVPLADCREQWQASKTWARAMEQEEDDDQNAMLREERRRVAQINERAVARATAVVRRKKQHVHNEADDVKKSVSFVADFKTNADEPGATTRQGQHLLVDDDSVEDQTAATLVTPMTLDTPLHPDQQGPSEKICITSKTTCSVPPCDSHDRRETTASRKHIQIRKKKDMVQNSIMEEEIHQTSGIVSIHADEANDDEHRDKSVVSMPDGSHDDIPGFLECEEVVVEQHQPLDEDFQSNVDEENDPLPANETPTREDGTSGTITVGSIVRVESRTWPGINKPGGVGRVTNVYADSHAFDVSYVLGGIEKRVGAAHITLEESHHPTSKRVRRGRDEIPVSLLQALARDGFDTARIGSSAATKRIRKGAHKENMHPQISRRTHVNGANATSNARKANKRKDQHAEVVSPTTKKARIPEADANLPALSHDMKCALANDRYRTLIEASMKKGLLNVVVSSLPEQEQAGLDMLVGDSKHQVGTHISH